MTVIGRNTKIKSTIYYNKVGLFRGSKPLKEVLKALKKDYFEDLEGPW